MTHLKRTDRGTASPTFSQLSENTRRSLSTIISTWAAYPLDQISERVRLHIETNINRHESALCDWSLTREVLNKHPELLEAAVKMGREVQP